VEDDRNALAASHPLAFPLGRSCAQRGAAGPADGGLVPVEHLVNGVSIVQFEAVERVAYFHVELDSHNVIVAEGAAAETFVDCDSRRMFHKRRRVRHSLSRRGFAALGLLRAAPRRRPEGRGGVGRRATRAGITVATGPLQGWLDTARGKAGPRLGSRCREFGHAGAGRGRHRRRRAWVHARQPLPRRSRNRRLWPRPARLRFPFSRATRL
jgi:hypothetical protein